MWLTSQLFTHTWLIDQLGQAEPKSKTYPMLAVAGQPVFSAMMNGMFLFSVLLVFIMEQMFTTYKAK